jgi:leucyl aminopeptidase
MACPSPDAPRSITERRTPNSRREHMNIARKWLVLLASVVIVCGPVSAQSRREPHAHAEAALASMRLERDPLAPVYVVMSRSSYEGMRDLVPAGVAKADSAGTALVVSKIRAYQLSQVSERIHVREQRCGGFFAFASREEADAFVRNDRSAQGVARKAALAAYTIDNQATVDPWLSLVQHTNIHSTISTLSAYQYR